MLLFRVVLLLAWLAVVYVTVLAISAEGVAASADIFAGDVLAGGWRGQFDLDLLAHMLLVGPWVAWRHKFSAQGIVLGLLCICGSLFSLAYVLVLSFHHKGDVSKLLLGRHGEDRL